MYYSPALLWPMRSSRKLLFSPQSLRAMYHYCGSTSCYQRSGALKQPSQSLGETIDSLLGVASADYGAAVGQPIIRGMSGTRVRVLNNGMVIRDVTSLGADHVNEVDFNHAKQVEIIKGPASLLYSNGVIGGIVNV